MGGDEKKEKGEAATATSWADVQAASTDVAEAAVHVAPKPAQETIRPGDVVRHAKHGDCNVHRLGGSPPFLHMARPNGKVIRLSLDIVSFTFVGIEGRARIFKAEVKK